jgi:hypothetical protein
MRKHVPALFGKKLRRSGEKMVINDQLANHAVQELDESPGYFQRSTSRRSVSYGLPCARCKAYYASEITVCPICGSRERVPASSADEPGYLVVNPKYAPEVSQSTAAILYLLPRPSTIKYYGSNVLGFYATQSAAPLIRLADAQTTFQMVRYVAIIDASIDAKHPDGAPERVDRS